MLIHGLVSDIHSKLDEVYFKKDIEDYLNIHKEVNQMHNQVDKYIYELEQLNK